MGVYPCGTITMVGELYGAESKQQVYGHLHSYFFDNGDTTSSISKICTHSSSSSIIRSHTLNFSQTLHVIKIRLLHSFYFPN